MTPQSDGRTTDNLGQTRRVYYDSRGLIIRSTDAQGAPMADPLGLYTAGNINATATPARSSTTAWAAPQPHPRAARRRPGTEPARPHQPANPDGKIIEESE